MSTATLTSLAILKVNLDQYRDYLDYLRPFALHALAQHRPGEFSDADAASWIEQEFGLVIPVRTVELVLKRLVRGGLLRREHGHFHAVGDYPDPGIGPARSAANRHISATVGGMVDFARRTTKIEMTRDAAVTAICAYLAEFDVQCLRAYLRGSTIPEPQSNREEGVILVSRYAIELQKNNPERFESFMVMVQGHMLANSLLCPDLQSKGTYRGVTFYLDTPLLVRLVGAEVEEKRRAVGELVRLLRDLDGRVAAFRHSREELERVLQGAADKIDAWDGRGEIIMEARRRGRTRSDLLLLVGQVDQIFADCQVAIHDTPRYVAAHQIDERQFEAILEDEVSYYNPRARDYDINSVRSIYALRRGATQSTLETSKAVLVTSNVAFARAAWVYGQRHDARLNVSSVIGDRTLANVAWLKAPMGAPRLPRSEVLAFSYAAVRPSDSLLDSYLREMDKLEAKGDISNRDHALLRSSPQASDELVNLTLGQDSKVDADLVTEVLRRVTREIAKEKDQRAEQAAAARRRDNAVHGQAQDDLKRRIYWRCARRAKTLAWSIAGSIAILTATGAIATIVAVAWLGLAVLRPWQLTESLGAVALAVASVATTVTSLSRERIEARLRDRMVRRESEELGLAIQSHDPAGAGGAISE